MTFCTFIKSITMFANEEAVGHRLIAAPVLKDLTNMAAIFDFVLLSILL